MKKTIIILALILISFTPEKKYHFEFNDTQLNMLWDAVDKSNAPHQEVKAVQELIQSQIKGQIQIDSTKLKK